MKNKVVQKKGLEMLILLMASTFVTCFVSLMPRILLPEQHTALVL